jgi:hypothetical protein
MSAIYGNIENSKDIGKINRKIRTEIRSAKSKSRITELKRRSGYLITLTYSPNFKKRYNVKALRKRARSEYKLTAKVANARLKKVCKACKKKRV